MLLELENGLQAWPCLSGEDGNRKKITIHALSECTGWDKSAARRLLGRFPEFSKFPSTPGDVLKLAVTLGGILDTRIDGVRANDVYIFSRNVELSFFIPRSRFDVNWNECFDIWIGANNLSVKLMAFFPLFILLHPFFDYNSRIGRMILIILGIGCGIGFCRMKKISILYSSKYKDEFTDAMNVFRLSGDAGCYMQFLSRRLFAKL